MLDRSIPQAPALRARPRRGHGGGAARWSLRDAFGDAEERAGCCWFLWPNSFVGGNAVGGFQQSWWGQFFYIFLMFWIVVVLLLTG